LLCSSPLGQQHPGAFSLSLNAVDASIKWWNGKPAPRATALRAPWSLTPNLQLHLKQFLRKWHLQVLAHQVPCHTPSFKMVFIKHAAVLDQLCNHKQAIVDWSTSQPAVCCCKPARQTTESIQIYQNIPGSRLPTKANTNHTIHQNGST
jgi:hypothetical protein